ncbi:MAG TPA: IMS domain-containing protein [Thermoanaerobaculia bacterium]|nr:IMS domain-containing protein [Thermoanaerobaculia bacterium]
MRAPLLSLRPAVAALALGLALSACAPSAEQQAADRAEIERLVGRYAELLAEAYRTRDSGVLGEITTEREVMRVGQRIEELTAEGRELRAELRSLVIEEVDVFDATTAGATTIEVWDLRTVALGSDETVAEAIGQENRVVYTLRKERGRWEILARLLKAASEPS